VLSQSGNPYPSGDAYNVYAARRAGNGTKSGAIIVINNHDTATKGLWVDAAPSGWASWSNTVLVNAFNPSETTQVYSDGRVYVSAPARGYAVYVKQSEYVAYTDPGARLSTGYNDEEFAAPAGGDAEVRIWANPVKDKLKILVSMPRNEKVQHQFISMNGEQLVQQNTESNQTTEIDLSQYAKGMYILKTSIGRTIHTNKVFKE
jgi:alpha-amylase